MFPTIVGATNTNTDVAGYGIQMSGNTNTGPGDDIRARLRAVPATPSWTCTFGFQRGFPDYNFLLGGAVLRESSTGKMITLSMQHGPQISIDNWNSPVSFNSTTATEATDNPTMFFRIADDGAGHYVFSMSDNGVIYAFLGSYSKNAFFTAAADQIGYCFNPNAGTSSFQNKPFVLGFFHYLET